MRTISMERLFFAAAVINLVVAVYLILSEV